MYNNEKIAFVIDGLQMGGAEKFLINLANNFYGNGYQAIIILLSEEKTLINELEKNIKVISFVRTSHYDLAITRKIKKFITEEEIRKVFCINAYSFFLTKLGFLFDKKTIFYLSLHSTIPFSKRRYIQNLIYLRLLSKRDKVIYVCQNQRVYLQNKYHISPPIEKVIYNGIDTSFFNPELFKDFDFIGLRQSYNLQKDDQVIINVARMYPLKGHFDAIDALNILHKKYKTKVHLLIVGGGDQNYIQSIKNYLKEKEIEEYIHFTGDQPDVRKFYYISDVFTLTSHTETFSLAALEAMAFGLPCSLTDLGGANEMIVDGLTGTLSKSRNPESIACSWNKLLTKYIKNENIRQFVIDKFDSKKMLKEYIELIEKA